MSGLTTKNQSKDLKIRVVSNIVSNNSSNLKQHLSNQTSEKNSINASREVQNSNYMQQISNQQKTQTRNIGAKSQMSMPVLNN